MTDIIRELVLKDLKLRYSRQSLGFLWTLAVPVCMVLIYYFVFSILLKIRIPEAPFVLYLMSAVFAWRFFQDSIIASMTSLVDNKNLLKESRIPYYFMPVSIVVGQAVLFLPALILTAVAAAIMCGGINIYIILLPVIVICHVLITLACAIIFSIFYVFWRDIRYVVEVVLSLMFYLTPVFYSMSVVKQTVPAAVFKVYISNPLVGIIEWYRFALLNGYSVPADIAPYRLVMCISPIAACIVLIFGACYLYRQSRLHIADRLAY